MAALKNSDKKNKKTLMIKPGLGKSGFNQILCLYEIDRLTILCKIADHLRTAAHLILTSPEVYTRYLTKAEALIELLEVYDTGSVGGFTKKGYPIKHNEGSKLVGRFIHLYEKWYGKVDTRSLGRDKEAKMFRKLLTDILNIKDFYRITRDLIDNVHTKV